MAAISGAVWACDNALAEVAQRLDRLESRRSRAEDHAVVQARREGADTTVPDGDPFARTMAVAAVARSMWRSTEFKWAPDDYYDRSLEWRAQFLGASSIHHMCKSIILANENWVSSDRGDANAPHYLVIIQYARRFHAESVARLIRGLNAGSGVARKHFVYRLAENVEEVTGYPQGAVTPLNCSRDALTGREIPIIIDSEIVEHLAPPRVLWLGGGRVNLKWRVDLTELLREFPAFVGPISQEV